MPIIAIPNVSNDIDLIIDRMPKLSPQYVPTVEQLRAGLKPLSVTIPRGTLVESTCIDGVQCEWITPSVFEQEKTIMFCHGGGFVAGSLESHRPLLAQIAEITHARVLSVDYRLAPEYPFPAGLNDFLTVYKKYFELGAKTARPILMGDSAGAGLILAAMLQIKEEGLAMPTCIVCLSPWMGLDCQFLSEKENHANDPILTAATLKKCSELYRNGVFSENPLVSAKYGDFSGFPPILIQIGSNDMLLSDVLMLEKKSVSFGNYIEVEVWQKMVHVWHAFYPILSEANQAIEHIHKFIKNHHDR